MKLKKVLASILCVAMVLSTMSFSVFAEITTELGGADFDANSGVVYDGTNYYDTLNAAINSIHNTDNAVLYCKSGADLGSMTHAHVCKNLTIYGNGATISGDIELDTPSASGSSCTGLESDVTLKIYSLNGAQVWGTKSSTYDINLEISECTNATVFFWQNDASLTSKLNITMTNCTLSDDDMQAGCGVFSKSAGAVTLTNVDFTGISQPASFGNITAASQNVVLKDCDFVNCGSSTADYKVPVSAKSKDATGTTSLVIDNCTFTGTVANSEGNDADIHLDEESGTTTLTMMNTTASVYVEKVDETVEVTSDETVMLTDTSIEKNSPVAKIGNEYYASLQEAIDAAEENDIITLCADINYENYVYKSGATTSVNIPAGKTFTLDLNGYTISGTNDTTASFEMITINNGAVVTIDDSSEEKIGKIVYEATRTTTDEWMYRCHTIFNKGTLILNNGTIENATPESLQCVSSAVDNNCAWGNLGTFIMNGGTVTSAGYYGVRTDVNTQNTTADGTLKAITKINGGKVYGFYLMDRGSDVANWTVNDVDIAIGDDAVIEAANYTTANGWAIRLRYGKTSDVSVNISENAEINGVIYGAKAIIGGNYYGSLEAAIAAATEGDTITILAGTYNGFNVPATLNNVTFVGETDADGNNLVTIKTLEEGIESHNGGIFVQAETTTFKNLNFTAGTVLGTKSGWMSASLGNTNGDTGMSSNLKNLTVENCNFVGSGVQYAIWTNQGNVTVKNSTITNYDTAVDTYAIGADQKMVIEDTEITDVRNAFHTSEAADGAQMVVANVVIDADVIDIGGAVSVEITDSEISNAVITTYSDNAAVAMSDNLLINSVISEDAQGTYNGENIAENYDAAVEAIAEDNEIIPTALNISFERVEAGLYNIVLDGEDEIYEFVAAELTFVNTSETVAHEYMNYEVYGIDGATNAEKNITLADTYALRLIDGAGRMSGRDIVIGQVKFFGQGDINFTVSEGKVVTTEYGTNLPQYYTVDADETTTDTLTVDAIVNNKVSEVKRDVVVNVDYNLAFDGTYWKDAAGNAANQITVTVKDGFGNVYDAKDLTNGVATIEDVKLGRLTVTLEAPGFRRYVYNTTLEAGADEDDALVLNFWNEVKRDTVQSPLAEIETGKGTMAHNFLVGDIVMDYTVDEYDLAAVTSYYGTYSIAQADAEKYIKYDLNRDGNIDIIDVHYVLHTYDN